MIHTGTRAEATRRKRHRWGVALCAGLSLVAAACGADDPAPATEPATDRVVSTTGLPPGTSTTTPAPEAAVDAVLGAIATYNAADVDGFVAAFHPDAEEVQREPWGYFFEILMNANTQLEVVEPCRVATTDPLVVECSIRSTDDFHWPAAIPDTAVSMFHLDDRLRITGWDDNFECCQAQSAFNRAFHQWLQAAHPDVFEQIQPFDLASVPGWRTDPAHMKTAIRYVDEFVEESDEYPIGEAES